MPALFNTGNPPAGIVAKPGPTNTAKQKAVAAGVGIRNFFSNPEYRKKILEAAERKAEQGFIRGGRAAGAFADNAEATTGDVRDFLARTAERINRNPGSAEAAGNIERATEVGRKAIKELLSGMRPVGFEPPKSSQD